MDRVVKGYPFIRAVDVENNIDLCSGSNVIPKTVRNYLHKVGYKKIWAGKKNLSLVEEIVTNGSSSKNIM